jgi:hypothetical protein
MRVRSAAALLLAVAAASTAAASAGERMRPSPPPPDARVVPPGAERVALHIRFPAWQYTGTFRLEGRDGTVDEGVARDAGGYASGDGFVTRTLEGARGTLRLRLQGGVRIAGGLPVFFGRWSIVEGDGAYAGLSGGGTFLSTTSGDSARGSPSEIQSLLGHVTRASPRQPRREKSQSASERTIETTMDVPSGK